MRDYEVVYIFRPALEQEEIDGHLERFHDRLGDAEISAVEHWGKRRLAYDIEGERNGYYVVSQFRADPSSLSEYEGLLKLEEELIRYLVVLSEGELPLPPSARGPEEDEDEEDEADEEDAESDDEEDEEQVEDSAEDEEDDEDEEEAKEEDEDDGEEDEEDDEEDEER